MLNSLATPTPPAAIDLGSLDAIGKLLDLLSDPKATAANVKALQDAATEHRATLDAVRSESAALDQKRQAHLDLMHDEREAHDLKLKTERAAWETERDEGRRVIAAEREAAKNAQAAAEAERTRALTLSNDLEGRLAMIQGAANAPLPAQRQ
jgi:hypothetical protein